MKYKTGNKVFVDEVITPSDVYNSSGAKYNISCHMSAGVEIAEFRPPQVGDKFLVAPTASNIVTRIAGSLLAGPRFILRTPLKQKFEDFWE